MRAILAALVVLVLLGLLLFVVPFPAHSQVASIALSWTAPGDDGNVGTASRYDLRWSITRPDTTSTAAKDAWWAAATAVAGVPTPLIAGSAQSVVVSPAGGFTTGRTYYFVIRSADEVPNWSAWSNVAVKGIPDTTPPAPIIDLRPS